jgi:DNA-binding CsgD family transcriptional regulator
MPNSSLFLFRDPGPEFSDCDRTLLTLLRPHLQQAYLGAERHRDAPLSSPPRHRDLLRLVAADHASAQIAQRLGLSEGTIRKHLENIYTRRQISSRTTAITRASPAGLPSNPGHARASHNPEPDSLGSGPRPNPVVPTGLRR